MDESSLPILLMTAMSIGFIHTVIGVDHALPFVALSRARGWKLPKTLGVTALCGLGHVLSSVVLGSVGLGLGVAIERLEWIEGFRGELTAHLMIGFGLAYAAASTITVLRNRAHSHHHSHADGTAHEHTHTHHHEHVHVHAHAKTSTESMTTWSLFILFVFGPCEALIPLLMAPAADHHWSWVGAVIVAFGITTIATMLAMVTLGFVGLKQLRFETLAPWSHTIAGLAIATSGIAVQALGI
jgi:sulfite exporter TauE/SafE